MKKIKLLFLLVSVLMAISGSYAQTDCIVDARLQENYIDNQDIILPITFPDNCTNNYTATLKVMGFDNNIIQTFLPDASLNSPNGVKFRIPKSIYDTSTIQLLLFTIKNINNSADAREFPFYIEHSNFTDSPLPTNLFTSSNCADEKSKKILPGVGMVLEVSRINDSISEFTRRGTCEVIKIDKQNREIYLLTNRHVIEHIPTNNLFVYFGKKLRQLPCSQRDSISIFGITQAQKDDMRYSLNTLKAEVYCKAKDSIGGNIYTKDFAILKIDLDDAPNIANFGSLGADYFLDNLVSLGWTRNTKLRTNKVLYSFGYGSFRKETEDRNKHPSQQLQFYKVTDPEKMHYLKVSDGKRMNFFNDFAPELSPAEQGKASGVFYPDDIAENDVDRTYYEGIPTDGISTIGFSGSALMNNKNEIVGLNNGGLAFSYHALDDIVKTVGGMTFGALYNEECIKNLLNTDKEHVPSTYGSGVTLSNLPIPAIEDNIKPLWWIEPSKDNFCHVAFDYNAVLESGITASGKSAANVLHPQVWWDFGDGQISVDQDPVHKYAHSGAYTVKLYIKDPGTGEVYVGQTLIIDVPEYYLVGPKEVICGAKATYKVEFPFGNGADYKVFFLATNTGYYHNTNFDNPVCSIDNPYNTGAQSDLPAPLRDDDGVFHSELHHQFLRFNGPGGCNAAKETGFKYDEANHSVTFDKFFKNIPASLYSNYNIYATVYHNNGQNISSGTYNASNAVSVLDKTIRTWDCNFTEDDLFNQPGFDPTNFSFTNTASGGGAGWNYNSTMGLQLAGTSYTDYSSDNLGAGAEGNFYGQLHANIEYSTGECDEKFLDVKYKNAFIKQFSKTFKPALADFKVLAYRLRETHNPQFGGDYWREYTYFSNTQIYPWVSGVRNQEYKALCIKRNNNGLKKVILQIKPNTYLRDYLILNPSGTGNADEKIASVIGSFKIYNAQNQLVYTGYNQPMEYFYLHDSNTDGGGSGACQGEPGPTADMFINFNDAGLQNNVSYRVELTLNIPENTAGAGNATTLKHDFFLVLRPENVAASCPDKFNFTDINVNYDGCSIAMAPQITNGINTGVLSYQYLLSDGTRLNFNPNETTFELTIDEIEELIDPSLITTTVQGEKRITISLKICDDEVGYCQTVTRDIDITPIFSPLAVVVAPHSEEKVVCAGEEVDLLPFTSQPGIVGYYNASDPKYYWMTYENIWGDNTSANITYSPPLAGIPAPAGTRPISFSTTIPGRYVYSVTTNASLGCSNSGGLITFIVKLFDTAPKTVELCAGAPISYKDHVVTCTSSNWTTLPLTYKWYVQHAGQTEFEFMSDDINALSSVEEGDNTYKLNAYNTIGEIVDTYIFSINGKKTNYTTSVYPDANCEANKFRLVVSSGQLMSGDVITLKNISTNVVFGSKTVTTDVNGYSATEFLSVPVANYSIDFTLPGGTTRCPVSSGLIKNIQPSTISCNHPPFVGENGIVHLAPSKCVKVGSQPITICIPSVDQDGNAVHIVSVSSSQGNPISLIAGSTCFQYTPSTTIGADNLQIVIQENAPLNLQSVWNYQVNVKAECDYKCNTYTPSITIYGTNNVSMAQIAAGTLFSYEFDNDFVEPNPVTEMVTVIGGISYPMPGGNYTIKWDVDAVYRAIKVSYYTADGCLYEKEMPIICTDCPPLRINNSPNSICSGNILPAISATTGLGTTTTWQITSETPGVIISGTQALRGSGTIISQGTLFMTAPNGNTYSVAKVTFTTTDNITHCITQASVSFLVYNNVVNEIVNVLNSNGLPYFVGSPYCNASCKVVGYQWQYSTDNSTWLNIPLATSKDYAMTKLPVVCTYLRRQVTTNCGTKSSTVSNSNAISLSCSTIAKEETGGGSKTEEREEPMLVKIAPNPTNNGVFNVELISKEVMNSSTNIEVYDMMGKKIKEVNVKFNVWTEQNIMIDCTGVSEGVYQIKINTGKDIIMKKVIIVN